LHLNKAKNADNARVLASIFNKVEVQKNKHVEIEPPADEDQAPPIIKYASQ
jgi:hypothetical protein